MSAWIRIVNDLILLAVEDRLWLVRCSNPIEAHKSAEAGHADQMDIRAPIITELTIPPRKVGSVRRNVGNENKAENERLEDTKKPTSSDDAGGGGDASEPAAETTEAMEVNENADHLSKDSADKQAKESGPVRLTSVHVPICQSYVLACTSDKRLVVWTRRDTGGDASMGDEWELHSVRETPRKCVQNRVTGGVPPMILVADRAGDVYQFPLEDASVAPTLLFGRTSMLLDMALSPSDNFVVVCDRDEKIAVYHYPQSYAIMSFCLGHRQFVTSIELLPDNPGRLVSVGGDGRLILWDIEHGGVQLASADCWAEAQTVDHLLPFEQFHSRKDDQDVRPPLKKVVCQGKLIAVLYCRVPYVHVFRCDGSTLVSCGGVATEAAVWDAAIDDANRLWVLTPSLSVFQLDKSGGHHTVEHLNRDLKDALHKALLPLEGVKEVDPDLDILYKQWFDNVEEYHERKRQREEEKKSKKRRGEPSAKPSSPQPSREGSPSRGNGTSK